MNTSDEKKYLAVTLRNFDRGPRGVLQSRWFTVMNSIVVALIFFALFKSGLAEDSMIAVLIAFVLGVVQGIFSFQDISVRYWPILQPHLNRESIESRLAELDEEAINSKQS
jgi:hypothetical protein